MKQYVYTLERTGNIKNIKLQVNITLLKTENIADSRIKICTALDNSSCNTEQISPLGWINNNILHK